MTKQGQSIEGGTSVNSGAPTPIMVVGDLAHWKALGLELPKIDGFFFVDFDEITPKTLADFEPQVVLSPLFGRNFDAIEIARRLSALGYKGKYRVLLNDLPKPSVIYEDVEEAAPGLDFSVLSLQNLVRQD